MTHDDYYFISILVGAVALAVMCVYGIFILIMGPIVKCSICGSKKHRDLLCDCLDIN